MLVLLRPDAEYDYPDSSNGIELRKKYSQSGIYICDGSPEFFWPMPYQPQVYSVNFSKDGEHVLLSITYSHGISNIPLGQSLLFYHKDREQNHWDEFNISWGYIAKESIFRLLFNRSWYSGEYDWKEANYDADAQTFTVTTHHAERFVFDIRTGEKTTVRSAWNIGASFFCVVVPLLVYCSYRYEIPKSGLEDHRKYWQVSLAEMFLLTTIVSLLFALMRYSLILSVVVAGIGLVGGAVARSRSPGRHSWFMGGLLAIYGTVLGLFLFSTLGERLIWEGSGWRLFDAYIVWMFFGCGVAGGIGGALVGGWLARRREQKN